MINLIIGCLIVSHSARGASLYPDSKKDYTRQSALVEIRGRTWEDVSSAINYGWNAVVSFTGAVTNQSVNAFKQLTSGGFHNVGPVDETGEDDCSDMKVCTALKFLSVVGIALATSCLLSLLIPLVSYGACASLGLVLNSFVWLRNLKTSSVPARDYHRTFHKLGLALLESMFTVSSVLLLWLALACIIGWVIWPYF